MKNFLTRILLALAITLIAMSLMLPAHAKDANGEPSPPVSRQSPSAASQQSPQLPAESPAAGEVQTQEALAFTGRVVKVRKVFVLQDATTKVSYQLDDQSKVKRYFGRQVKVTGKLEMNSNTIHIDSIEPLS
jgi:hypothetical protein